jgi:hypothetical protein
MTIGDGIAKWALVTIVLLGLLAIRIYGFF